MAIFHMSVRTVSRSDGRSAIAAAAYRSGTVLTNRITGRVSDFRRKSGVRESFLVVPPIAAGAAFAADREALWSAAEEADTRRNSTTAREYVIALPAELPAEAQRQLTADFARLIVDRFGVAIDVAIHEPGRHGDQRNHHAHLLATTREATADGLGAKTRVLDSAKTGSTEITKLRADWAALCNQALELHESAARITHLSRAARKLIGPGTKHLGPKATAYERRLRRRALGLGVAYEPRSRRAKLNKEIMELRRVGIAAATELNRIAEAEHQEALRARQTALAAEAAEDTRQKEIARQEALRARQEAAADERRARRQAELEKLGFPNVPPEKEIFTWAIILETIGVNRAGGYGEVVARCWDKLAESADNLRTWLRTMTTKLASPDPYVSGNAEVTRDNLLDRWRPPRGMVSVENALDGRATDPLKDAGSRGRSEPSRGRRVDSGPGRG